MFQEIRNNLTGSVPTLRIYIDYRKAYDIVWHKSLIVKLARIQMSLEMLKLIMNWVKNRQACVTFGNRESNFFQI